MVGIVIEMKNLKSQNRKNSKRKDGEDDKHSKICCKIKD